MSTKSGEDQMSGYNYSFQNRNNSKVPLDSKLLVVPKINSCGGYSIELLIQSGEKVTLAWSVKYLTDIETVWEISKNMSLAVYEGTFNNGVVISVNRISFFSNCALLFQPIRRRWAINDYIF